MHCRIQCWPSHSRRSRCTKASLRHLGRHSQCCIAYGLHWSQGIHSGTSWDQNHIDGVLEMLFLKGSRGYRRMPARRKDQLHFSGHHSCQRQGTNAYLLRRPDTRPVHYRWPTTSRYRKIHQILLSSSINWIIFRSHLSNWLRRQQQFWLWKWPTTKWPIHSDTCHRTEGKDWWWRRE